MNGFFFDSFEGLNNLTYIGGNFTLNDSWGHENMEGLNNVEEIGGDLNVLASNLISFDGFDSLQELGGGLEITNNSNLVSLEGLQYLELVNGYISIVNNNDLISLEGLNNIDFTQIATLNIEENDELNYCNFDNICDFALSGQSASILNNSNYCYNENELIFACTTACSIDTLRLTSQAQVDSFPLLYSGCTSVNEGLVIASSDSTPIYNLDGLSPLTLINGGLQIYNKGELTSLEGLQNVTWFQGPFTIVNNDALIDFTGLENISWTNIYQTRIKGNENLEAINKIRFSKYAHVIEIIENPALEDLSAYEDIEHVNQVFTISGNTSLQNVDDFQSLALLKANLLIKDNSSLTNLDGFSDASSSNFASSLIALINNEQLYDISGLENLDPFKISHVFIESNPNLSECHITSICGFLENGNIGTFEFNLSGCNSNSEVMTNCGIVSTEFINNTNKISLAPNPTSGYFMVNGIRSASAYYTIYSILGTEIQSGMITNQKILDISNAPSGIYLLTIAQDQEKTVKRIIRN